MKIAWEKRVQIGSNHRVGEQNTIETRRNPGDLRSRLRDATHARHERLDEAMRQCDWTTLEGYARFLEIQYAARHPIEDWAANHYPTDERPPAQAGLIAQDLASFGRSPPPALASFVLPNSADPIGLAWALAGSSLGNRMILRDVERAGQGEWPARFLSDPAMQDFWQGLRSQLARQIAPDEAATAIKAAETVFDHFLQCVHALTDGIAA